jgi:hypothetical protein
MSIKSCPPAPLASWLFERMLVKIYMTLFTHIEFENLLRRPPPASLPHSGFPPPSTPRAHIPTTSLQLLQDVYRIVARHVKYPFSFTAPTNLLHNIARIRCTDHRYLGSEPLLERFSDKVAVRREPLGERRADVNLLGGVRIGRGRCKGDIDFVDGKMLLRRGCDPDLVRIRKDCVLGTGGIWSLAFPVLPSPSYTVPASTNHSQ